MQTSHWCLLVLYVVRLNRIDLRLCLGDYGAKVLRAIMAFTTLCWVQINVCLPPAWLTVHTGCLIGCLLLDSIELRFLFGGIHVRNFHNSLGGSYFGVVLKLDVVLTSCLAYNVH